MYKYYKFAVFIEVQSICIHSLFNFSMEYYVTFVSTLFLLGEFTVFSETVIRYICKRMKILQIL